MDARFRDLERSFLATPNAANLLAYFNAHQRFQKPFNLLHLELVPDLQNVPTPTFLGLESSLQIGTDPIPTDLTKNLPDVTLDADIYTFLDIFALCARANPALYYLKYIPEAAVNQILDSPFSYGLSSHVSVAHCGLIRGIPNLLLVCGLDDYYYPTHGGSSLGFKFFAADNPYLKDGEGPTYTAIIDAIRSSNMREPIYLNYTIEDQVWYDGVAKLFDALPGFPLYRLHPGEDPDLASDYMVDYFYSIESLKHLASHFFRDVLGGPNTEGLAVTVPYNAGAINDICEDLEIGEDYLSQLWNLVENEEWCPWPAENANNLNFVLPRLIDSISGQVEFDPSVIISHCGADCRARGYGNFQTAEDVEAIMDEAMHRWSIIKYFLVPPTV